MSRTLVWQLSLRYLRGKRSANAVPVLSRISMVAIAVGSCAMIVLFSVFNGFEGLIKDLYKAFYPEIKVSPAKGKFFSLPEQQLAAIRNVQGIKLLTTVIEDNVLAGAEEQQQIATIKGIDTAYLQVNDIRPYIYDGRDCVVVSPMPTAIVGLHLAGNLALDVNNVFSRLSVYYLNANAENISLNPTAAYQSLVMKPDGVFRVQDEFDNKYILAPLPLVQELFLQPGKYSSIEISLNGQANEEKVKRALQQLLGDAYKVQTRYEQNQTLYMVMKTEKWAVYAILVLVLLIASFNMIGALSLLVMEKQKDIAILKAMGVRNGTIRNLFVTEGVLWAFTGGMSGLLLGAALCLGQLYFHWIKLGDGFIIEAYPVALYWSDFVLIIITVLAVGLLAAWFPSVRATRAEDPTLKSS